MIQPQLIVQRDDWNSLLQRLPTPHILQSWEWGDFKQATTGWTPERFAYRDQSGEIVAAAGILTRRIGFFAVMYVPKGPVMDFTKTEIREAIFDHLQGLARRRRVIWLKIDPDIPAATGIPDYPDSDRPDTPNPHGQAVIQSLRQRGWRFSSSQVQFRSTLMLDLSESTDEILAGMSQSTRRKIRKAEKSGVVVREADLSRDNDLKTLYDLYNITGDRQDFVIRPLEYYREAWTRFQEAGLAHALIAEMDGKALAGLVLYHIGNRVWYFYGMSSSEQRDLQPNYTLQWNVIQWAKANHYQAYDWWGAPDIFSEDDPMWGVYRFKDGFGGKVVRWIGAWDFAPYPVLYSLYERVLPVLLKGVYRVKKN